MKYILGKNREQTFIFPVSVDETVSKDNDVRLIDLFVDGLNIGDFGFRVDFGENGRPAYHPADLLKLYIYGYMNKIRSSRDLEKECKRNIEVIWLLKSLQPDHNTISNFRRDNSNSIREVFQSTVKIATYFDLIGKALLAGDGTKLRAQNSKKNNYNHKKIERHLEYIENKLTEYNKSLSEEDCDKPEAIHKEISKQQARKEKYNQLENQLQETGQEQISTSDTDSRQMIIRNNITEVAYNVQVVTDSKYCMPIDYQLTNNNDSKAMSNMVERAIKVCKTSDFTILFDKGYHTGSEIKKAQDKKVNLLVAVPDVASNAPDKSYNISNFIYDKSQDFYICPEQQKLITNGRWYDKNRGDNREIIRVKQYKTKACKNCPSIEKCTTSKKNGRVLERSEYAENIERNKQNVEQNQHLYKRRQAIVEHPFGTLKRQWGFNYIITKKGMDRASSDVGFMLTAYNLRRIFNIIGFERFKKYMEVLLIDFMMIIRFLRLQNMNFNKPNFGNKLLSEYFYLSLNRLIFSQKLKQIAGF